MAQSSAIVEEDNYFHGLKLALSAIALSLVTFMFVLDYTVCNVAIPYIAGGLAAGIDQGTFVLTFFSVGNAIFLPLTGWLASRFGSIRTLFWAVVLFTIFSALCGLAKNLHMLVIFRFLQGASAGPLVPLSQGALAMIFPPKKLNSTMIVFSMIILIAPVLGPIVGGYFCIFYNWRWIFYINVPVGIYCAAIIWSYLHTLDKETEDSKVDYASFALLLIGVTTLQLLLDRGEQWGWFGSTNTIICFVTTVITLSYLVLISFTSKKPLLNLKIFASNKPFALSCILIFFMYAIYMGTVVLVPLWLQTYQGYNALWSGIAVAPIGLGSVIVSPLMGRLIPRIGRMIPIIIGLAIMAIACLYTRNYYSEYNLSQVMWSRFILGLGVGCWIVPIMSMPAFALKTENMASGLGLFHFIRVLSGAIGISTFTTLFKRRTIHQHFNISSNFNEYLPNARAYMDQIRSFGIKGDHAKALADRVIDVQAAAIGFDEVSIFMFWICIVLIFFSIFALKWEMSELKKAENQNQSSELSRVSIE